MPSLSFFMLSASEEGGNLNVQNQYQDDGNRFWLCLIQKVRFQVKFINVPLMGFCYNYEQAGFWVGNRFSIQILTFLILNYNAYINCQQQTQTNKFGIMLRESEEQEMSFRKKNKKETEDDYSKYKQPEKINKNSFLISYGGGSAKSVITEIQKDFKWITNNSQKILQNKDYTELPAIYDKLENLHQKYKNIFQSWKTLIDDAQDTYHQIDKWTEPIQDLFKKKKEIPKQEQESFYTKRKYKPIKNQLQFKNQWGLREESNDMQEEESDDDDDDGTSIDINGSDAFSKNNLFLKTLMQHINSKIQICLYFPAVLTVTLVSVNKIDHLNEIAWISLGLELKINLPKKMKPEGDLYNHLKKIKINFYSKKMKNKKDNKVKTAGEESDPLQKGDLNGIEELIIWNNAIDYYRSKFNLSGEDEQTKEFLSKLKSFTGIICSAQMKNVQAKIDSNMLNSPFQMIDLNGSVSLDHIRTSIDEWKDQIFKSLEYNLSISPTIVIKFNLINLNKEIKYNHNLVRASNKISINDYHIANKFLRAEIGHSEKRRLKLRHYFIAGWKWVEDDSDSEDENNTLNTKQDSMQHSQDLKSHYCSDETLHFHFPMYRNPLRPIGAIYPPLLGLSVTNLLLFFQDYNIELDPNSPDIALLKYLNDTQLANRLSNIALVFVSFIGTIAILKSQMNKPEISIAQILIYLLILTPVFCVIFTMTNYLNDMSGASDPLANGWFWASVIISSLNFLYPLILLILYFCQWRPKLKQFAKSVNENIIFPGAMEVKYSFNKGFGGKNNFEETPLFSPPTGDRLLANQLDLKQKQSMQALKQINEIKKTKKIKPILEIPGEFNNRGWKKYLTTFAQDNLKESLDSRSFREKLISIATMFPKVCEHLKQIELKQNPIQKKKTFF